jgi:hypothetical protein
MNIFKHSGAVGDLIYALPTIKALGGGILYLSCEDSDFLDMQEKYPVGKYPIKITKIDGTRTAFSQKTVDDLYPLLIKQDYLVDVKLWEGQKYTHDMNEWRVKGKKGNLCIRQAEVWQVKVAWHRKWLHAKSHRIAPYIFARSPRHRNLKFPWKTILDAHASEAVFVGLPKEHENFEKKVGKIPYFPTANFLELAEIIAGCDLFIGNQSAPYAIAEALKANTLQETSLQVPDCIFPRVNAQYYQDKIYSFQHLAKNNILLL